MAIVDATLSNTKWVEEDGRPTQYFFNFMLNMWRRTGSYADPGLLEDLNTLGPPTVADQFIVSTAAGVFAYESGDTARVSIGVGTTDSPTFTSLTLSGADTPKLTITDTTNTVTGIFQSANSVVQFGSTSDHPVQFLQNGSLCFRLEGSGNWVGDTGKSMTIDSTYIDTHGTIGAIASKYVSASDNAYGGTQDSAAIQAAIDAITPADVTTKGGGFVYLDAGEWAIDAKVILKTGVILIGAGQNATVLKAATNLNDNMFETPDLAQLRAKVITGVTLGGTAVEVIVALPTGHGFSNADVVEFNEVVGTTELNGNSYTLNTVGANAATLTGTDSDNFSAWVSDGFVSYGAWLSDGDGTGAKTGQPDVPHGFGLMHLQIDGNKANQSSGNGVVFYGKRFIIDEVIIRDCYNMGWYSEAGDVAGQTTWIDLPVSTISGLRIRNCGDRVLAAAPGTRTTAHGFHFRGPHDAHIEGLFVNECAGKGAFFERAVNLFSGGCDIGFAHVYANSQEGVDIDANTSSRFRHLISESNGKEGLTCPGGLNQFNLLQLYRNCVRYVNITTTGSITPVTDELITQDSGATGYITTGGAGTSFLLYDVIGTFTTTGADELTGATSGDLGANSVPTAVSQGLGTYSGVFSGSENSVSQCQAVRPTANEGGIQITGHRNDLQGVYCDGGSGNGVGIDVSGTYNYVQGTVEEYDGGSGTGVQLGNDSALTYSHVHVRALTSDTNLNDVSSGIGNDIWVNGDSWTNTGTRHDGWITRVAAELRTTTATTTTIDTIPLEDLNQYHIRATFVGNQESSNNGASYVRDGTFYRNGGNATQEGSTTDVHTAETTAGWEVSFAVSGNNVLVQVVSTAVNMRWGCTVQYINMSSD